MSSPLPNKAPLFRPAFVILDRDGVINQDSPDYIKDPDEWLPEPGSIEAIARLTQQGIAVYVATNQAGLARGKFELPSLEATHQKMRETVAAAGGEIAGIRYCPHHPDDNCVCRKPAPGLLHMLADDFGLKLADGYFVGDSLKDLQAAEAAGSHGALVLTGNGQKTLAARPDFDRVFSNLAAFVDQILNPQDS